MHRTPIALCLRHLFSQSPPIIPRSKSAGQYSPGPRASERRDDLSHVLLSRCHTAAVAHSPSTCLALPFFGIGVRWAEADSDVCQEPHMHTLFRVSTQFNSRCGAQLKIEKSLICKFRFKAATLQHFSKATKQKMLCSRPCKAISHSALDHVTNYHVATA